MSATFSPFRAALYQYHRLGLDAMADDLLKSKEAIANAITTLAEIQKVRPNSLLVRTFFDAKADEIVAIFAEGPRTDNAKLIETLQRISPLNSQKWNKIR